MFLWRIKNFLGLVKGFLEVYICIFENVNVILLNSVFVGGVVREFLMKVFVLFMMNLVDVCV